MSMEFHGYTIVFFYGENGFEINIFILAVYFIIIFCSH